MNSSGRYGLAKHFAQSEKDEDRQAPKGDLNAAQEEAPVSAGDTVLRPIPTIDAAAGDDDARVEPDLPALKSSYNSEGLKRVRRKHTKRKNPLLIGLAIAAGVVLLLGGIVVYWVTSLNRSLQIEPEEQQALVEALAVPENNTEDLSKSNAFYALIVGSDARTGLDGARGDVMMLCRIDPDAGTVHLISIPRDTMINLGGNTEKINASFAYAGAAGAVSAVSSFAGVPISHYAEVDFNGLVEVVDLVGGVWVNVPEAFSERGYSFEAGEQLMNGDQALVYARQRYSFSGGDFTRTQSQRQIVEGIIDKILAASPGEIPSYVRALAGMVSTDCNVTDLVSLALAFRENGVKIYSTICPSYTLWQDGVSYVGTMYDEWAQLMQRVDAGMDPASTDPIPEAQASNEKLGAATNAAGPRDYAALAEEAGLTTDDVDKPQ